MKNKLALSTLVIGMTILMSLTASAKEKVLYSCNEDQKLGGSYGSVSYDQNGITIRVQSKVTAHEPSKPRGQDDYVVLAYSDTSTKVMSIKGHVQITKDGLILTLPGNEVQLEVVYKSWIDTLEFNSNNAYLLEQITENTGYGVNPAFPTEALIGLGSCIRIK